MANNRIVTYEGDSHVYLQVNGAWYKYDADKEPLGKGAMGTVYLGYRCISETNHDTTNEKFAIKRVNDRYVNNRQVRERARLEGALAFKHPHLVEMVGCCEAEGDHGPVFIVSRFMPGCSIREFVNTRIPKDERRIRRICNLIFPVLDALSYIHSHKFIHRDIKPSNIMVENFKNVRVMDLGIARMNGGNRFSECGFIGTPQYSAPEQILRGMDDCEEICAATDIYALGVTLYELITGCNPFKAQTEIETLTRQLKMLLPSHPAIPWHLMRVLRKATEKDVTKRYRSAAEFKVAIRTALDKNAPIIDWLRQYVPFV